MIIRRFPRHILTVAVLTAVALGVTPFTPSTPAAAYVSACGLPPISVIDGGGAPGAGIAYQASSGRLWTADAQSAGDAGLGLMARTSPAITALAGGGFQMAFQANTGSLWTSARRVPRLGPRAAGRVRAPASPALAGGGFQVAFQANTGSLWTVGTAGMRDWGLGMRAGHEPVDRGARRRRVPGGISGQHRKPVDRRHGGNGGLAPRNDGGTSPSIAALLPNGFQVAFQANTGCSGRPAPAGVADWRLGMQDGTSPAVAGLPGGGLPAGFPGEHGQPVDGRELRHPNWGLGMLQRTSPAHRRRSPAEDSRSPSRRTRAACGRRERRACANWQSTMRADTSPAVAAGSYTASRPSGGKPSAANTGVPARDAAEQIRRAARDHDRRHGDRPQGDLRRTPDPGEERRDQELSAALRLRDPAERQQRLHRREQSRRSTTC